MMLRKTNGKGVKLPGNCDTEIVILNDNKANKR